MAVTWDFEIKVINIQREEVRITATRTDDDPEKGNIRVYVVSGPAKEDDEKLRVLDHIWERFQTDLKKEPQVATIVTALKFQAKQDLESRESLGTQPEKEFGGE